MGPNFELYAILVLWAKYCIAKDFKTFCYDITNVKSNHELIQKAVHKLLLDSNFKGDALFKSCQSGLEPGKQNVNSNDISSISEEPKEEPEYLKCPVGRTGSNCSVSKQYTVVLNELV